MEDKILKLFLHNNKLKFSEIEKLIKERSNKLAYHIKKLVKEGVIEKNKEHYKLSESAEHLIPYLSNKKSVLPVILIALKKDKKVFLYKRNKRPYKDKLSLPGGRLIFKETIPKATQRIVKEKFKINCKFKRVNSISLEHVKNKSNKEIYSFLLIFVTATTKDKISYLNVEKNKKNIISSDYKLIKNDSNKKIKIKNILSRS